MIDHLVPALILPLLEEALVYNPLLSSEFNEVVVELLQSNIPGFSGKEDPSSL